jgi:hypothetical protein
LFFLGGRGRGGGGRPPPRTVNPVPKINPLTHPPPPQSTLSRWENMIMNPGAEPFVLPSNKRGGVGWGGVGDRGLGKLLVKILSAWLTIKFLKETVQQDL